MVWEGDVVRVLTEWRRLTRGDARADFAKEWQSGWFWHRAALTDIDARNRVTVVYLDGDRPAAYVDHGKLTLRRVTEAWERELHPRAEGAVAAARDDRLVRRRAAPPVFTYRGRWNARGMLERDDT